MENRDDHEEDFVNQARNMVENAKYFKQRLEELNYPVWLNEFSNTPFFKRPSDAIIDKYDLAVEKSPLWGDLAHAVVMQHVDKKLIDAFIEDLKGEISQKS